MRSPAALVSRDQPDREGRLGVEVGDIGEREDREEEVDAAGIADPPDGPDGGATDQGIGIDHRPGEQRLLKVTRILGREDRGRGG